MNKSNITDNIVFGLAILFFSLPIMEDMISAPNFIYVFKQILGSVIIIFIVFRTYKDIKDNKYSKNIYIILTDILIILAMAGFIFVEYKSNGIIDKDRIYYFHKIINKLNLVLIIGLSLNRFLRKEISIKPPK